MSLCARIAVTVVALAFLAGPMAGQTGGPVVSERSVSKAIDGCVEYLYSAANTHGIWDALPGPDLKLKPNTGGYLNYAWSGRTALVLHALAMAGQQGDPRFKKALAWLMKQQPISTYALACRLQLIHELTQGEKYRAVVQRDGNLLLRGARRTKGRAVTWNYFPPPGVPRNRPGDYSNVNYAVLGLWAAGDERFEIPDDAWRGLELGWVGGQHPNGGWSYLPVGSPGRRKHLLPTGSMTTAGIASLYLVIDRTYARRGRLGGYRTSAAYKSIQRGLGWMDKNFSAKINPGGRPGYYNTYYFYNCERVAAAAGLKYFGTHDWFREIAANILRAQKPSGAIAHGKLPHGDSEMVHTALALLFLCKGSAPVIFNKLQHAGDWDNHLSELTSLTGWLARQSERPANWQVVNLKVPAEDLTDSRILYIAGTKALDFTPAQQRKLERFVDLGGMLLFHPDTAGKEFPDSVEKLLGEIWPELELTNVDLATHPVGSIFLKLGPKRVRLKQLARPTRVLAMIVHGVPAEAWQRRHYITAKEMFALGANLHYFANDRAPLHEMPTKLTRFADVFRRKLPPTSRTIALARIRYCDSPHRWNPEPLAFERFARVLALTRKIKCELKVVTPARLAEVGARIAHLAGVGPGGIGGGNWDAIDAWLKAGGTLIVDQAGGPGTAGDFGAAFRKLIAGRYGPESLAPVPATHPLLEGLDKVSYRHVRGAGRGKLRPRLEMVSLNGRPMIIYSRLDLTCGLLGCPNPLVRGADEDGAYRILASLLDKLSARD